MRYWIFISCLFFLSFFFLFDDEKKDIIDKKEEDEEVRAVYFSYIEFSNYIMGKSEEIQKKNIIEVLDNIKSLKFNRIIVHVRPFADSIYESNYYPVSKYVLNDENEYPNYDVLRFFIDEAHKRNINLDAWINPYRISNLNNDSSSIMDNYPCGKTSKGLYLNPSSEDVVNLIVNGIKEIVLNYDVDGIHFDDYFYPDDKIDLNNYKEYVSNGGKLSIEEYRYENVKKLLREVYSSIKKVNKNVIFGIAPEGNIDNCYSNNFLDIKDILSKDGYIDYVMPQIYYGFYNKNKPFINTINEWNDLIKVNSIKLIPALAIYKSGNDDKYALDGRKEWIQNDDIIKREIVYSRSLIKYKGFSLFSYNYIFNDKYLNNNSKNEIKNIKELL